MAMALQGPICEVHFGFTVHALFLCIDFDDAARQARADFDGRWLGFGEPAGYEVLIAQPGSSPKPSRLLYDGKPRPAH